MVVFGTTYIAGCFDDVHPIMLSIYQTIVAMMSAMMTDRTSKTLRLFLKLLSLMIDEDVVV